MYSKVEFEMIVEGAQGSSSKDAWQSRAIVVHSRWNAGTDQEKFEVLAAMRRAYNPGASANIRGDKRQSPAQIARAEGFTALSYRRARKSDQSTTIVRAGTATKSPDAFMEESK